MFLFVQKAIAVVPHYFGKAGDPCTGGHFLGLPPWWQYLDATQDVRGECNIKFNFPNDIWAIALAAVDILIRVAGILAVIFIIYAGISLIMSQGNSEKTAAARKRIINSLIGLVIILIASTLVAFIGNAIGN